MKQLLVREEAVNRAYSPLNLYIALSMLAELTDGESREQLLALLDAQEIDRPGTTRHDIHPPGAASSPGQSFLPAAARANLQECLSHSRPLNNLRPGITGGSGSQPEETNAELLKDYAIVQVRYPESLSFPEKADFTDISGNVDFEAFNEAMGAYLAEWDERVRASEHYQGSLYPFYEKTMN